MLINHVTDSPLWGLCEAVMWSRTGWVARNMANVKAGSRGDRLKAALRENLKRRKAQTRSREQAGHDPAAVDGEGLAAPGTPGKGGT